MQFLKFQPKKEKTMDKEDIRRKIITCSNSMWELRKLKEPDVYENSMIEKYFTNIYGKVEISDEEFEELVRQGEQVREMLKNVH